jgi:hypothetical protein
MLSESRLVSRKGVRISLVAVLAPLLAAGAALVGKRTAHAEDATGDQAEQNERCAVRLSIALTGKSPEASQLTSSNPQGNVDAMLDTPEFADRYASFVNSEFNGGPISAANDDPIYTLAKHVITEKMAWSDLFQGPYSLTAGATASDPMEVGDDTEGLGYFRSDSWRRRYAGNEQNGIMLVAAFRIVQNTTGLDLTPSIGQPGDKRDEDGRRKDPCKSCHFDSWFAIDTVASLLPLRNGTGATATFPERDVQPVQLLGKTIASDKELVSTLVASDAFKFNQCRMVFKFLYGRPENQCEAKTFDACVTALETTKTIQSAVAAVAKDASFCTN